MASTSTSSGVAAKRRRTSPERAATSPGPLDPLGADPAEPVSRSTSPTGPATATSPKAVSAPTWTPADAGVDVGAAGGPEAAAPRQAGLVADHRRLARGRHDRPDVGVGLHGGPARLGADGDVALVDRHRNGRRGRRRPRRARRRRARRRPARAPTWSPPTTKAATAAAATRRGVIPLLRARQAAGDREADEQRQQQRQDRDLVGAACRSARGGRRSSRRRSGR